MRVNYVGKATGSKKRPWSDPKCMKCGRTIVKGDPYKWAKGRYSYKRIACGNCSFTRADLTDSIKGEIYSAFEDAYKELDGADETTDFDAIRDAIAEAVREVEEQYRSTSEEYFSGGGPQAEMADECDSVASDLENIDSPEFEEFEAWAEANKEEHDVPEFDAWFTNILHLADDESLTDADLRAQYDEYVEDEMRGHYDEYVQELVQEFISEIENCDQL